MAYGAQARCQACGRQVLSTSQETVGASHTYYMPWEKRPEPQSPESHAVKVRKLSDQANARPSGTKFCRHCGKTILADSTFCEHCGKEI